ncbi:MAG: hypothetical protein ACMXYE_03995 [Candidatus Woesearchaeota archaeon]
MESPNNSLAAVELLCCVAQESVDFLGENGSCNGLDFTVAQTEVEALGGMMRRLANQGHDIGVYYDRFNSLQEKLEQITPEPPYFAKD